MPLRMVAEKGFIDNAQTALAWAIKLKLYNTEEQKQEILSNLAASVENENQSVSTIREKTHFLLAS